MTGISNKSIPNLYLVGMMGSGKSVTGKKLAERMGLEFADLDEILEHEEGRSISEIFRAEGEEYFREKETQVLNKIASLKSHIVATGGGVVLREENLALMKDTGIVIYLETSPEQMWERVRSKKNRPLLDAENPEKRLAEIYQKRKPIYKQCADLVVPTDGQTPDAVAKKITQLLEKA